MHRVECESCKASYQVDERRIPANGLKMRCPKCGHTFIVKLENGAAVVKNIKGSSPPPAAGSKPEPPPAPVAKPASPPAATDDPFGDLPSPVKPGMPPTRQAAPTQQERRPPLGAGAKPALPATRQERPSPLAKKDVPPAPASKPGAPPMPNRLGVSLDDLPAVTAADRPRLPPTRQERPSPLAKKDPPPAPKPQAIPDLDADLPMAAGPHKPVLPATVPGRAPPRAAAKPVPPKAPSLELDMDLPAKPKPDLPAIAARLARATHAASAPPSSRPPKEPGAPAASAPELPSLDAAFGEIDLPAIGADLPAVAADLPELAAGLPEIAAALPEVASALPEVASALPEVAGSLPATAESLPVAANALPANLDSLPTRSSAPPAEIITQDDLGDFGELDLPPGPLSSPPGARSSAPPKAAKPADEFGVGRAADFGDLLGGSSDVGAAAAASAPMNDPFGDAIASVSRDSIPDAHERKGGGGGAFGEVDLGDAPAGGAEVLSAAAPVEASLPVGPPTSTTAPRVSAAPAVAAAGAPTEVAIGGQGPSNARDRSVDAGRRGGRRWMAGVLVVVLLGGAALEATPYGAFGRYPISDLIHAGDYQRLTMATAAATRTKLLADLYPDSKAAVDAVDAAHRGSPRARSLAAYLAIAVYGHELRFGENPADSARAKVVLGEIPPGTETKYVPTANALQDALGDIAKGRASLDAASKRDPGDPIQEDVAYARGALELRARDGKAAATAFEKALQMRPSDAAKNARAHYGLARAHYLDNDVTGAKKELDLTLTASPKHAGAHLLKAKIAWNEDHDDKTALDELASILEGAFKAGAAPSEQASAFALRGDIQEAQGRPAEARAAYDAALKLEAHNVDALIGQGEVLYSEGRFTEALSRFDTAVQADPLSVRAILSDAKGKIALEKLADAKTQLTAARTAFPKDPRVAVELGKANEALGDKPAAEHEYLAAIDLVDVTKTEAIEPYVALAGLLAAEGRTKDAEAKLEEARSRLQDSAPMQRALGEVAAAQGNYDDAVTHYKSAIEKNPNDISTKFLLGVTYRRMGKMDLASAEFDEVVALDKDYPGLALERGLLYEASGDVDKALEQFQSALAKAPDDPDLELRVGAAYVAIGRPADAVPVLQKVLAKRPESAEANHYLGRAMFLQGGTTQGDAMRYLKRAVELDPNRAEYHLYVGWAANNAVPAQLGLAKDEIDKALSLDKLLADAYWQRGALEQKEGSIDDAMRDLKRALELKPTRTDAHATLALCYDNKNDTASEMAEWQKAIAGNDRVPEWRLRYGKLLLERGSTAEAAKHLAFAATEGEKLDPRPGWLFDAEFAAGEALRKTGARDQAIERYKKFLEIAPTSSPDRKDAVAALASLGVQAN